jgi:5-methylcytosine-specific restriction endonuclease McrA
VPGKTCSKCGEGKELSMFSPNKRTRDGVQSSCRACQNALYHATYVPKPRRERAMSRDEYQRRYRLMNREKIRATDRAYREANRNRRAQNASSSKEAKIHYFQQRRARKASVTNDLSVARWREILAYFGGRCAYCQKQGRMTQDHIVPISRGGGHTAANVVPACGSCNSIKRNAPLWVMLCP